MESQCSHASPLHDIAYIQHIEEEVQNKASFEPKNDLPPVSLSEVQTLVKSHKTKKAPGVSERGGGNGHSQTRETLRLPCQLQTDQPPDRSG
ncbi:hypothetical protein EVAR_24108_1 [Eumeta japonica]|uniref:Uncharacterized protein n=1 Tax=Eumeta variegata TaxID=151549 RepID=A0A4C2A278_EUMVA|nr:hypothetical protein EVAR_24108_1 [Eumeta japonica]